VLGGSLLKGLKSVTDVLLTNNQLREAEALSNVSSLAVLSPDFGGLGYSPDMHLDTQQEAEIVFLVSAWLESLNSVDRSKSLSKPLTYRPKRLCDTRRCGKSKCGLDYGFRVILACES
jgi:hypothetical protein